MRHLLFEKADNYPIALLIKASAFNQQEIINNYVMPLGEYGVQAKEMIAFTLDYNEKGKAPVSFIKNYLNFLLKALDQLGVTKLYVADAAYFKVLTKVGKVTPYHGYVMQCVIEGYEHMDVILGVNHKAVLYDPKEQTKLDMGLRTLALAHENRYLPPGEDIIHQAYYPNTLTEIDTHLTKCLKEPELSCDIETASLRFNEAGIATIAFAWNQHEGVAFACDYEPYDEPVDGVYGKFVPNPEVRDLLRHFFENYTGTLKWHNASFDLKVLIYTLWMDHLLDTKGLLKGLEIMTRYFHDTQVIAYLATNSTAGNTLGLKPLSHEFTGNYAQEEISNVFRIPLPDLLEYNLVDTLATNYVFNTYHPKMVEDQQVGIYQSLMLPSLKTIIQMELTGMPLCADKVQEVKTKLEEIRDKAHLNFAHSFHITQFEKELTREAWIKDYEDRRRKAKNPDRIQWKDWDSYPEKTFNPNSGPQLQKLLYEYMELPVLDFTKTKQPATGADTLKKLIHHTDKEDYKEIINALIDYAKVDKILTTFIPAFEDSVEKDDGRFYLHGSFVLGGTVSGRLSSRDPNMQNLPSGSLYGKLIKQCFRAPDGWIFAGSDFASLEDRINALLTKDPNKLKVYTDGYDGHSLRAYHYWPNLFPHLKETPEDINSIKQDAPDARQDSKTPTFALTYQGTWMTLVKNSGFSEEEAKAIESAYHQLYSVSTEWTKAKIDEAARQGFSEAAFGLRIRTPLLHQTMLGHRTTPREAEAEARTLGNAISGQSYGLLTNRAANDFMEKVWASPYREDVKPIAMIHDAIYLLIRDDVEVVNWVNQELIRSMQWQELPEIQHDEVKLGAELSLFYPDWSNEIVIPNDASINEIINICTQEKQAA